MVSEGKKSKNPRIVHILSVRFMEFKCTKRHRFRYSLLYLCACFLKKMRNLIDFLIHLIFSIVSAIFIVFEKTTRNKCFFKIISFEICLIFWLGISQSVKSKNGAIDVAGPPCVHPYLGKSALPTAF